MKDNSPSIEADRIILALLEHGTQEKAAAALGISATTVWRWFQKPEFQDQYRAARRQALSHSKGLLLQAAPAAAAILLSIMRDKKARAANRLRASKSILKHGSKPELEALLARIASLEQTQNDTGYASAKEAAFAPLGKGAGTPKKISAATVMTERIVAALLEHGSHAQAAASLNISVTTVWRHLQTPECKEQLAKARREAYSRAIVMLQHAAKTAVLTLLSLMVDERRPAIQVQAADCVLEYCSECAREDAQGRVEELEQARRDQIRERERRPRGHRDGR
jgi:predicted DNA-binding protein (UPF0251 family)